ncbi:MAG: hypothetical protein JSW61_07230 [Candidatus Thorarchaeota archaeon]|nr:MAG: hypothetical protein JSW61_07230 [Candidatus Thorarchaeota archaeon]
MSFAKQLGVVLLALTFIVASVPAVEAKQIRSTMEVNFNPEVLTNPTVPIWQGYIHGDIEGTMKFWATGPIPPKDVGNVHFFTELWTIVDGDGHTITGIDKGSTTFSNWKFRMNGVVTEATGKYADLVGHQVHMNGQIYWSTVLYDGVAIGPVLIN